MRLSPVRLWPVLIALVALPLCAQQQEQQQDFFDFLEGDSEILANAGGLLRHDITDFGPCSFFAKRGVRWRNSFSDGSSIELTCDPDHGHFLPGFHLWYQDPQRNRVEIGRCIFDDGFNRGWYYTPPGERSVARIVWQNLDGGKNDGGGRPIDRHHRTGPEEPYLDVVRWVFDVRHNSLRCVSDKYQYLAQPPRLPADPKASLEGYIGPLVSSLRRSFVEVFE